MCTIKDFKIFNRLTGKTVEPIKVYPEERNWCERKSQDELEKRKQPTLQTV